jgi:hypothetical protein
VTGIACRIGTISLGAARLWSWDELWGCRSDFGKHLKLLSDGRKHYPPHD